jgi:ubiquinone/menaquinone biosynthesis C-methylase UbiE
MSFSFADDAVIARLSAMYLAPDLCELRAFLLDRLAPQSGERVLDIGCGPGVTLAEIASRIGPRGVAVGLDVAEPMLEAALKRAQARNVAVELHHGGAEQLPFPDASFDAVLCVQVLEYCADPATAVAEAMRVARPGGRLVLSDTDWDTAVYPGADRALTRRVVAAWSDHDADGWMGRRLNPLLRAAGAKELDTHVYVVTNDRYEEPLMGWSLSRLMGDWVAKSGRVPREEVDRWHGDLEAQHQAGRYFFSLNRYVCAARR